MKTKSLAALGLFLCGLAGTAGALEWNVRQLSLTPASGATEMRGRFEFSNPSRAAVHIVDLTTSCGCTVATTASSDIPAGSRGTINFVFTVGKRSGLQEKKIFVQTDESPDPVVLELRIRLPDMPVPSAG